MVEVAIYVENRKVDAVSTASSFLEFGRLQLPVRWKKEQGPYLQYGTSEADKR